MNEFGESIQSFSKGLVLTAASMNTFTISTLTFLWSLISSLQLIIYIKIMEPPFGFSGNLDRLLNFFE